MAPVCLEESILRQNKNGAFAIAETTDRGFPADFLFYFLKFPLAFPSIRAITNKADGALTSVDTLYVVPMRTNRKTNQEPHECKSTR